MDKKLLSIAKHCKHTLKLNNNFSRGHLSIFYISNIAYIDIHKKAWTHRYKFYTLKKNPFSTHLSLSAQASIVMRNRDRTRDFYSRSPINSMLDKVNPMVTDDSVH